MCFTGMAKIQKPLKTQFYAAKDATNQERDRSFEAYSG